MGSEISNALGISGSARPAPSGAMAKRYRDAYRVAESVILFGALLKGLGWLSAIAIWGMGVIAAVNHNPRSTPPAEYIFGAAAASGVALLVVFLFFGVLISAVGQMMRATLDTAVFSCPFLDDGEKSSLVGL